jgi:hypothetical protein
MGNLIPLVANSKTHERKRLAREQERDRLIRQIGIRLEDAPLYSEELRFLAYMESLGR